MRGDHLADINARITEEVTRLTTGGTLSGRAFLSLGIAPPGMVDTEKGVWLHGLRVAGITHFDLRGKLEESFSVPVTIEDPARCIAWLERTRAGGQAAEPLVVLYLGDGVGAGMVLKGELFRGASGLAGEIGHMHVAEDGDRCSCGNIGCLEMVVSQASILRRFRRLLQEGVITTLQLAGEEGLTLGKILEAAQANDRLARSTLYDLGLVLGDACATLIELYNPQTLLIGGSVGTLAEFLKDSIVLRVGQRVIPEMLTGMRLDFPPLRSLRRGGRRGVDRGTTILGDTRSGERRTASYALARKEMDMQARRPRDEGDLNMAFLFPDEIASLRDGTGLVILPLAPIEWHGPHLAMGCDPLLAHGFARRLAAELRCPYFPPLYVGTERERRPETLRSLGFDGGDFIEGMDFPALPIKSAYVREEVFASIVRATVDALLDRMGFKSVVIVNGHGADNQRATLDRLCREYNAGGRTRVLWVYPGFPRSLIAGAIGHATAEETSMLGALWPSCVDLARLPAAGPLRNVEHAVVDGDTFDGSPTPDYTVREAQDPRVHTDFALGERYVAEALAETVAEIRKSFSL